MIQYPTQELRCFPRPAALLPPPGTDWPLTWGRKFAGERVDLSSPQSDALGRLIPALLCGEQSAQYIFHQYALSPHRGVQGLLRELAVIEREEEVHERALQWLSGQVGPPADLHLRKRKAQRFYSSLARDVDLGQHFASIAALDSCVCRIMDSLATAQRDRCPALYHLFSAIKQDEARHVGVSRRCAALLGVDQGERAMQRARIGTAIVPFLQADGDAFESLGVDADRLFRQLAQGR